MTYYFFCQQEIKFFSQSRHFSTIMEFFHNQVIFPESRDFSTVNEFFYIHGIFQQSRNFLTIKKLFVKQGICPQSNNSTIKEFYHSPESFPQSRNFSTVKGIFHTKNIQTRRFSMKYFCFVYQVFHKQSFSHSQKRFFQTDQKAYLKAKVLDTFNTKLCAEIFSPFNAYW